jgi:sodium/bile acid cotransporter 7
MVNIAKGNVPAAIFNASISGLIGIVITPLWMGLFMQHTATDFDLSSIYLKLITEILLPVALGVALQPYWGKFAREYSSYLTSFDRSIILLIIFKSFAESFEKNVFSSVDVGDLLLISVATTALFYAVFFLTGFLADQLGFNQEDRITVQFCGSKKSLVHGTVFSKILFQQLPSVGIMLLPLMIFHALQLFIVSVIASKLAKRDTIPA